MNYRVLRGRVESFCRHYRGQKFHALFGDPPYHLTSITKRFGGGNAAPAQYGRDGAFARASRGFMGQQWDGGGVAFDPETWAMIGEHLYPGAFGMASASSRGWHRLACAIEDAGFIIHPSIFWAFGSGFPKATRIDTQIDKAAGIDVERGKAHPAFAPRGVGYRSDEFANNGHEDGQKHAPQTELAQAWAGHRYGLQAIKPAVEPIIVFQKPYEGRPVDCITGTGAGALNVDGGRVACNDKTKFPAGANRGGYAQGWPVNGEDGNPGGRWPSNLILECTCNPRRPDRDQHGDGCPVRLIGEQSGESLSTGGINTGGLGDRVYGKFAKDRVSESAGGYGDTGTAARFFQQCDWSLDVLEQLQQAEPLRYEAKASRAERDAGLDNLPRAIKHAVSGVFNGTDTHAPNTNGEQRNPHPTVKPISLAKYLATLLLPPAAYAPRRILVPFSGVGSEMVGAVLAGWDEVIGVEMTKEYIPVANARLAWWSDWVRWGQSDVDKILAAVGNEMLPMFQGEAA